VSEAPTDESGSDTFYEGVELQEPIMHAVTGAPLPEGHWLLAHWANDEGHGDQNIVGCEQCGLPMYDKTTGTIETWVETGRLTKEHGETAAFSWCLNCFATNALVWPDMREWWALHNGGPLPVITMTEFIPRDQLASLVYAAVAASLSGSTAPVDPSAEIEVDP
jgi:hypothetical protein